VSSGGGFVGHSKMSQRDFQSAPLSAFLIVDHLGGGTKQKVSIKVRAERDSKAKKNRPPNLGE
jgi:hypothetical protein